MVGRTLYEKLWASHVVRDYGDGTALIYIDRHLLHETSTHQSFIALRQSGRTVWRPETNLAVPDHAVPTVGRDLAVATPDAAAQIDALRINAADFGIEHIALTDGAQGIVHVIGPEQGFTLPGTTLVCGDSHTSTHGALGALAFGIGASDCATVLATQCIVQSKARTLEVRLNGTLPFGISAKDVALALIGRYGTGFAVGYAVEYRGEAIEQIAMPARMTLCNMTIEAGARVGLIAPDETTFAWLENAPRAPKGEAFAVAVEYWRSLSSDADAQYDLTLEFDVSDLAPQVTWGTSPQDALPISANVPDPASMPEESERLRVARALEYMGLQPNMALQDIAIDTVFIGSCTNGRLDDLRAAAQVAKDRRVAEGVRAIVVPGSTAVRQAAEAEGLHTIFLNAGFEWRQAGCSMCVAMNGDILAPGERSASTSNRNFEGRQGQGARTHLVSPAMAAAAAVSGRLADVREFAQ